MPSFTTRAAALATLVLGASALDGIVTPANITAGEPFDITFKGANDNTYRVYLAAALAGVNGPTCKHPSQSPHHSQTTNTSPNRLPPKLHHPLLPPNKPLHPGFRRSQRILLQHRNSRPHNLPRRHILQPIHPPQRHRLLLRLRRLPRRKPILVPRSTPLYSLRMRSKMRHGFLPGRFEGTRSV